MNTKQNSVLLFIIFNFANIATAFSNDIAFESTVKIKKTNQLSFEELKAGEKVKVSSGDHLLVISKQGLPLLIFSPGSKDSNLVIQDGAINAALNEQLQPVVDKATNEVIDGLRKAETFIQKRDFSQASSVTNSLKGKYANLSSVLFMSGTVNFLMNNKQAAIEDLQKGLILTPDNDAAKKLLAQLKGGT